MNKIKLFFLFAVLPLFCFAQTGEERIFIDGLEQAYFNFPSNYVAPRAVRFVLPQGYESKNKNYPVVYVFGEKNTKNIVKTDKAVFVFVPPAPGDAENPEKVSKFLSNELVLYTDVNYRTLEEPRYRLLAARGSAVYNAAEVFAKQIKIDNIALLDAPAFNPAFGARGKIWLNGVRQNIIYLNKTLLKKGYVYGKNMLYGFTPDNKFENMPLETLLSGEAYSDKFKVSLNPELPNIPAAYDEGVGLDAKLDFGNGMICDYIIDKPAFSAEMFDWDAEKQVFTLKKGAKPGVYGIEAVIAGKKAKTKLKLF